MTSTLGAEQLRQLLAPLAAVDARLASDYPGGVPVQPAHTCYVPADRVRTGEGRLWGEQARALLDAYAPDQTALEAALGRRLAAGTYEHLLRILHERPVADLRVDVEDGFGYRGDADEDAALTAAVAALAEEPTPSYGVRIKPFEGASVQRAVASLDLWLRSCRQAGIAPGVLTLPKVQDESQVSVALDVVQALEDRIGGPQLAIELQVETAAAVVDAVGRVTVPLLLAAGRGRVTGLHFGTYDYTSAIGLAPQEQSIDAPLADAAKDLLQLSAAARGVAVSDGSSNLLPIGGQAEVHAAWREHSRLVDRAMVRGLWQGWDLHPGQLVSRWATTVSFLAERLPEVQQRLAGQRTDVADEPATARMLRAFAERATALGLGTPTT